MEFEYYLKCVIIGDSDCGKTSIVERISNNIFNDYKRSTIGVEFKTKIIKNEDKNKLLKLRMWDIGGHFSKIVGKYLEKCDCIVLVYDITDKSTFINLKEWIKYIHHYVKSENYTLVLLGNKCDKENKFVKTSEGILFKNENKIDIFEEVSAKTGQNIEEVFYKISENILDKKETITKNENFIDNKSSIKNCFGFF